MFDKQFLGMTPKQKEEAYRTHLKTLGHSHETIDKMTKSFMQEEPFWQNLTLMLAGLIQTCRTIPIQGTK